MAPEDQPRATSNYSQAPSSFNLQASYQSPANEPFTHTQELPALASDKPGEKVTYVSALRKAAVVMQEQINKELTSRMEEDKKREGEKGTAHDAKVDEAKEEDTYGEEVVEED
ncbi:hypothetical protein BJ875DRAFT_505072 [Amylocarpus encephaloides]|uniref:EKC/KEOPS complex subunit GON7 n=1 Tax=Amylocarpus encephaloides TaxID=45428 RepID=A0A9P8C573_9HELO|nr:hypothetical protein BJ875DRAFT_505072 [Amylocarpus encephaloides]